MSDKKKKVTVYLTHEAFERLQLSCKVSGYKQSEYVESLIEFVFPMRSPDKVYWKYMNQLGDIHNRIKANANGNAAILSACKELEQWLIDYQRAETEPWEVYGKRGDDKIVAH